MSAAANGSKSSRATIQGIEILYAPTSAKSHPNDESNTKSQVRRIEYCASLRLGSKLSFFFNF